MEDLIRKYFPDLEPAQYAQFEQLIPLYTEWNAKINVVSRQDIENLMERHILHSLAIAKYFQFKPDAQVLDLGTGGGFPGIPLAIFFSGNEIYPRRWHGQKNSCRAGGRYGTGTH